MDDNFLKGGAHAPTSPSPIFPKVVYTFANDVMTGGYTKC